LRPQGDQTLSALGILADATASANSSPRMNRSQPAPDDLDVSQEIQSKFDLALSSRGIPQRGGASYQVVSSSNGRKGLDPNHLFLLAQRYGK